MSGESHWKSLREASFKRFLTKVKPLTPNHEKYLLAIESAKAVFCTGPAGSGKTWQACGKAVEMLRDGSVGRIVLSRPLQECDEELGFLPGDTWEKIQDMMSPLTEALDEFLDRGELDQMMKDGRLAVIPLAKMRGRTIKNSFVILDEAQNATYRQLKMFVTRFGNKCKMVVCGDPSQSDLPYKGLNSLREAVGRFKRNLHPSVSIVEMGPEDIVRDELVRWFDEVLSDSAQNKQEKGGVGMVPCPACDADLWYPKVAEEENFLVKCHQCSAYVDLFHAGQLDPATIASPSPADVAEAVLSTAA